MAARVGHMVLECVIDPEPVAVQDGRGGPHRGSHQAAKQTPVRESGKRLLQKLAGSVRCQLNRSDRF